MTEIKPCQFGSHNCLCQFCETECSSCSECNEAGEVKHTTRLCAAFEGDFIKYLNRLGIISFLEAGGGQMSYINVGKVLEYLNRLSNNDGDCSVHSVVCEIKEWVAHNIEEDVEPVRRGKWVQFESETGWGDAFECSVCGGHDAYETRYCPSCGAKMEGKGEI